jgi:flagellar hook assembly protein FlgD
MPEQGTARVTILDAQGRRIAEPLARELGAGPADVAWDGRDASGQAVAAGVYFARVSVPGASAGARGIVLH